MSASVLQEIEGAGVSGNTVTQAVFANSVTAGSAIHAIFLANDVAQTNAMTGAAFNLLDGPIVLGAIRLWHYGAYNVAGGATTIIATMNASSTGRSLVIREIGQVTTTPIDGHNYGSQSAPGTAPNGVATAAISNVNAPALLSAFALRCFYNTSMTANTAWVAGIGASTGASGAGGWATESLRVANPDSQTGSFTVGNSGNTISVLAIFDELVVAPSVFTPPRRQRRVVTDYYPR